jgi:putative two-component system response regulator
MKKANNHIETEMPADKNQQTLRNIFNATINVIADVVESRDKVTGVHIERTQAFLKILVNELIRTKTYIDEISKWDLNLLIPSAQIHDLGKITISDLILNKPDYFTAEEFEMVKLHCVEGEQLIDQIISKTKDDGFLFHARKFAGSHHEKWDGTGYPRKLKGQAIPLEGRIMALADVYDALISERPYKKALSHEEAVENIKKESGVSFDPKIVKAFLNTADEFKKVLDETI